MNHTAGSDKSVNILAVKATIHCLTGCAVGEILGMVVASAIGLSSVASIILAIALAFVFGYSLSLWTVVRGGMALSAAMPIVFASDTLSITVMEITDNLVMVAIPGALHSGLSDPLFWISMIVSLVLAFCAALPVNRYLLKRGKGHALVHQHMHHHQ